MPGKQSMLYIYVNMAVGIKDRIEDGDYEGEDLESANEVLADVVRKAQNLIDKRGAKLGYLLSRAEYVGIHP